MHMLAPEFLQMTCSMLNAVFPVYIITLQVNQLFGLAFTMGVSMWWPEFTEMQYFYYPMSLSLTQL